MPATREPHPAPTRRRAAALRRRTRLRGWRGWMCAGLALAAVGAAAAGGGDVAGLLLIALLLLALDSVVPVPGGTWSEADDHLRRAARRSRRHPPQPLPLLDDRIGWASTAERQALGVQPIPLDSIVGTVEPFKARTFDRSFQPDRTVGEHWKHLWLAQSRGVSLPPISVYRVGAEHYLRDGHHRVSVARDIGSTTIDADVVELRPPGDRRRESFVRGSAGERRRKHDSRH